MTTFERRAGSPTTFTVRTRGGTYTFDGDATVDVSDPADVVDLLANADLQVVGEGPPPIDKVYLLDGVLVRVSDGSPVLLPTDSDAGTITASLGEDGLPLLTVTSPFGIDGDDEPYYDPGGAAPLEAAMLTLDPDDGLPVLTTLTGGF